MGVAGGKAGLGGDAPWAGRKWTVYRGVAYDLQPFFDARPDPACGRWVAVGIR